MPEPLCLIPRDPGHPDAVTLLNELSDVLAQITGSDGRASFNTEDVRGADAAFLVGYRGALPVACGGFRALTPDVAEVKRVYTREHGTGQALLQALEKMAAYKGYDRLVCETRRVNRRAVAFYLRAGWRETAPYGPYVGRPEAICFEKLLAATTVTHNGAL